MLHLFHTVMVLLCSINVSRVKINDTGHALDWVIFSCHGCLDVSFAVQSITHNMIIWNFEAREPTDARDKRANETAQGTSLDATNT